jgi:hypothetical protein
MSDDQPQMPTAEQPAEPESSATPITTETQPANQSSYRTQMLLGILSCWLLLPGIAGFVITGISAITDSSLLIPMVLSLIPIGLGVLVVVRRRKRGPGLGVGFLTGLLLIGLGAGLCFGIVG